MEQTKQSIRLVWNSRIYYLREWAIQLHYLVSKSIQMTHMDLRLERTVQWLLLTTI